MHLFAVVLILFVLYETTLCRVGSITNCGQQFVEPGIYILGDQTLVCAEDAFHIYGEDIELRFEGRVNLTGDYCGIRIYQSARRTRIVNAHFSTWPQSYSDDSCGIHILGASSVTIDSLFTEFVANGVISIAVNALRLNSIVSIQNFSSLSGGSGAMVHSVALFDSRNVYISDLSAVSDTRGGSFLGFSFAVLIFGGNGVYLDHLTSSGFTLDLYVRECFGCSLTNLDITRPSNAFFSRIQIGSVNNLPPRDIVLSDFSIHGNDTVVGVIDLTLVSGTNVHVTRGAVFANVIDPAGPVIALGFPENTFSAPVPQLDNILVDEIRVMCTEAVEAVGVGYATNVALRRLLLHNCTIGLDIVTSSGGVVATECDISNSFVAGLSIRGSNSQVLVQDNRFARNCLAGVYLQADSHDILLLHNVFVYNGAAVIDDGTDNSNFGSEEKANTADCGEEVRQEESSSSSWPVRIMF